MEVHRREHAGSSVSKGHQEEGKHVNNPIYSRYKNENLTAKNVWNGKENKNYKTDSAVQKDFAQLKTSMPSKKMKIQSTMAAEELPENLHKTETPMTRSNDVTFGSIKQLTHVKTTPTKRRSVLTSPSFTKGVERQNTSVELTGNILKKFAMHNKSLLSTTGSSSSLLTRRKKTNSRGNFSTESKTEISFSFKQKTASKLLGRNTTGKTTETMKNVSSFKQQEERFVDESTLRRRADMFLRKIKDFGMTYSESFFHYKRQQNSAIFYREVLPVSGSKGRLTVFLLHDSDQDSRIWLSTGTLYSLGIQGHRVVALDLPGYGKSTNISEPGTSLERLKLLASFMFTVSPKGPRVLVSAGESGLYSVPIVISASVMLKGVVFVSTAHTGKFPASNYENVHLPALVIHGENDNSAFLKVFLESMKHLSEAERISLEQSGRYCYIEKPDHFHRLLNKFLLKISPERKKHSNKSRLRRS
ncbi:uncharacterized protein LOC114538075 [Dendronephthya gigantea]|uniref:uncharacterized protein LOC114538075 n=1 Tax=Dendronephthya gigantea TaxID=151771 RepID=UPI0010699CE5|nr:uncharacterized protein LOC114538075 [Dendronephthya gigantea]